MLHPIKIFAVASLVFLQSCQTSNDVREEKATRALNLSKAASYNTQLGLSYLKQGDRPRAKRKLFTALKQEPGSTEVQSALAYYFEQSGDMNQAKSYYLKAIALAPGAGAQLNNYGAFLCRQENYVKAIDYFLNAVKDDQYVHTAGAYENAGLCSEAIPDYDKAKLYFKKALEQDPSKKQSFYEWVKIENKLGNTRQALDLVKQYSNFSNDPVILSLAKDIAQKSGDSKLQTLYQIKLQQLKQSQNDRQYSDNSGVNDEHNNPSG